MRPHTLRSEIRNSQSAIASLPQHHHIAGEILRCLSGNDVAGQQRVRIVQVDSDETADRRIILCSAVTQSIRKGCPVIGTIFEGHPEYAGVKADGAIAGVGSDDRGDVTYRRAASSHPRRLLKNLDIFEDQPEFDDSQQEQKEQTAGKSEFNKGRSPVSTHY